MICGMEDTSFILFSILLIDFAIVYLCWIIQIRRTRFLRLKIEEFVYNNNLFKRWIDHDTSWSRYRKLR